jgi:hypothetical protein
MKNDLPLDQREISLRFPQRALRSTFVQGMSARFASTTIRLVEPDNEIRFSGVDESGKPWTLTAHAMQRGAIYSADLDNHGTADLVYAAFAGGNGLISNWRPPGHGRMAYRPKQRATPSGGPSAMRYW